MERILSRAFASLQLQIRTQFVSGSMKYDWIGIEFSFVFRCGKAMCNDDAKMSQLHLPKREQHFECRFYSSVARIIKSRQPEMCDDLDFIWNSTLASAITQRLYFFSSSFFVRILPSFELLLRSRQSNSGIQTNAKCTLKFPRYTPILSHWWPEISISRSHSSTFLLHELEISVGWEIKKSKWSFV